jgi:hypothetical protein
MNNNGMTLAEFVERANDFAASNSDTLAQQQSFVFNGRTMSYQANSDTPLFGNGLFMYGNLTDWAYRQVVERLDGPPVSWIGEGDHCPPELHDHILNTLASERDTARLLVRGRGEAIRAVLSDQYTVFDHHEFLPMVAAAVGSLGIEENLHKAYIDDHMRAYILFPQVSFGEDPGDREHGGLHPAFYISNNEIGGGGIRIAPAVYRSICSNGAIFGWREKGNGVFIRHRWIDHSLMNRLVANAIAESLEMSEAAAKMFMDSVTIPVAERSLRPLVDRWASKYGLSVPQKDNWLGAITIEAGSYGRSEDIRAFDVVNALTLMAQGEKSVASQESLEIMAGDVLSSFFSREVERIEQQALATADA